MACSIQFQKKLIFFYCQKQQHQKMFSSSIYFMACSHASGLQKEMFMLKTLPVQVVPHSTAKNYLHC